MFKVTSENIKSLFAPQNGYEQLLDAIFYNNADTEFTAQSFNDLHHLVRNGTTRPALLDSLATAVHEQISTLEHDASTVILLFFGIGYQPHTAEEIVSTMQSISPQITKRRVIMLKEKALRQLRHPMRSKHLKRFYFLEWNEIYKAYGGQCDEIARLNIRVKELAEALHAIQRVVGNISKQIDAPETLEKLRISTETLNLSLRTKQILNSAGFANVGDFACKKETEMLKMRNFGRKSLIELTAILEKLGLSWGMDVKKYGYQPLP